MLKNTLLFILLFSVKLSYSTGYSGLNADLELLYLGVFVLILAILFSTKVIKWIKHKVTNKNEIVD
jgi:hypothetical protein